MANYPVGRALAGEDGSGDVRDAHVHSRAGHQGVVTFGTNLDIFTERPLPFFNATNGIAMNLDASFGGTPDIVATGGDAADWTFSNIVGTKGADGNSDQANTGSLSVHWNNGSLNDVIEFDKGSDLTIANYVAVTLAIYVDKDWSPNDEISIYAWDTGLGEIVGAAVNLSDFFDAQNFDVWQSITITFGNISISGVGGSTTFDAIRFEVTAKSGPAPKIYLDDIQVEQTGSPAEYRVTKDPVKDYIVDAIYLTFADALAGTVTNGTMPGLAYNQFLGVSALANGIVFRRVRDGEVTFSLTLRQVSDFLRAGAAIKTNISDGTNTMLTLELILFNPILLQGSPESNYISLSISDDLSGLLLLNGFARGSDKDT